MLPKASRIQKKSEISRLFKARLCVCTEELSLKVAVGSKAGASRLLIVVSKKLFKKATKRNRLKRRLMHVVNDIFIKDSVLINDFFLIVRDKRLLLQDNAGLYKAVFKLYQKFNKEQNKFTRKEM